MLVFSWNHVVDGADERKTGLLDFRVNKETYGSLIKFPTNLEDL